MQPQTHHASAAKQKISRMITLKPSITHPFFFKRTYHNSSRSFGIFFHKVLEKQPQASSPDVPSLPITGHHLRVSLCPLLHHPAADPRKGDPPIHQFAKYYPKSQRGWLQRQNSTSRQGRSETRIKSRRDASNTEAVGVGLFSLCPAKTLAPCTRPPKLLYNSTHVFFAKRTLFWF